MRGSNDHVGTIGPMHNPQGFLALIGQFNDFTGCSPTARPSASSKSSCANAPMPAFPVLTGTRPSACHASGQNL